MFLEEGFFVVVSHLYDVARHMEGGREGGVDGGTEKGREEQTEGGREGGREKMNNTKSFFYLNCILSSQIVTSYLLR